MCFVLTRPYAKNRFRLQSSLGNCSLEVHHFVQTSSEVDRAPTPWKCLHHRQQVLSLILLRDYIILCPSQCLPEWTLSAIDSFEEQRYATIKEIHLSGACGKAIEQNQRLEDTHSARKCPKNRWEQDRWSAFTVGHHCWGQTGFHNLGCPLSLINSSDWIGLGHCDVSTAALQSLVGISQMFVKPPSCFAVKSEHPFWFRFERNDLQSEVQEQSLVQQTRSRHPRIVGFVDYMLNNFCLCDVGFKAQLQKHRHVNNNNGRFILVSDKIDFYGKHFGIQCHGFLRKYMDNMGVEQDHSYFGPFIDFISIHAWRLTSLFVIWLCRVLGQTQRTRVVILKQCNFVKGRRVWCRDWKRTVHLPLLLCFSTATQSHYDIQLGPFNELSQHSTTHVCFVVRPVCALGRNHKPRVLVHFQNHNSTDSLHRTVYSDNEEHCPKRKKPKGFRDEVFCPHKNHNNTGNASRKLYRRVAFQGVRVGEAKVPGPDSLDIGCFNPTQLFGKEEDIMAWGQGIYCAAETSVTTAALKVLRPRLTKRGFHSVWSEPVEPIQPKVSQIRGKASGVAIISSFPIRQFHEPITCQIEDSCRLIDGVVQLGPNSVAYVASIYGVATSSVALDPISITNSLFNYAAERALSFRGPAIIAGDLNCNLSEIGSWEAMRQNGWSDAAVLDGILHNRDPQPTSKEAARKSFILMNGPLAATLQECRACEDHLFPVHPLLLAKCKFQNLISPSLQWVLPKSVDGQIFDKDLLDRTANDFVVKHQDSFKQAIDQSLDKAASLMAQAIEHSWCESCVDAEGNRVKLSQGHLGRDKLYPLKTKACSVPVVRKARDGDFDPGLGQPSVEIRRHTRQLRRIESLYLQLVAYNKAPTQGALVKCKQLWCAILNATGFTKSFSFWICNNFQFFVPVNLPHTGYILELKNVYRVWHQAELNRFFLYKMKARKKSILQDIAGGGSRCFEEIRDPPPLPQSFVANKIRLKVLYTVWPKHGKKCIKVPMADKLDLNTPILFQNQTRRITRIQNTCVFLDSPVRLKSLDMFLEQLQTTADPLEMHSRTFEAWNEHWTRDHKDPNDDSWDDVIPYLQHIDPVPEMPFQELNLDIWNHHLKAVKTKTARGGCGFSAKEMIMFPSSILEWLFEIYSRCEKGQAWPKTWVLARVSMLAKSPKPTTPFDARPITVFSVLYRQWARIRSKQILQRMATYMPKAVSMATCRVPADVAAAYIATMVEDAINDNRKLAGLGIDLKRCFNTLPRWPLTLAMHRMGIPKPYIQGWCSMLDNMQRTLWLGSCQSNPQQSTTGAPEGCGFSVVAMAVMSWWQAMTMKARVSEVESFTYADNWNYAAISTRVILSALEELELFVSCMRMQISPSKSWLWATDQKERKKLQGVKVNNESIPVVTSFSDLGCDVQYSRAQKKPKLNKRWNRTIRLCKRIGYSKTPRKYKEHMTMSSGLSGAIFGAPISYIPKTRWRTLRSSMAQTVRLATAGASAWLSMGCIFKDPQLKSLGYTLCFWRRFLEMFPDKKTMFVTNMQREGKSKVGPIACLKKTLYDAGWRLVNPLCIQHTATGYKLDWLEASRKYLWFVLERQWCYTVSTQVSHRKDWQQETIDMHLFVKLTNKRSPKDFWILRTAASGKHYTNDIICKYTNNVMAKCPFCDSRDSKDHRLWDCPAFNDIRSQYRNTVRKVKNQQSNLGLYALPKTQKPIVAHLPDADKVIGPCVVPPISHVTRFLFLDGTAFGQEYKDLTVSAWAVTEADYLQHNFRPCDKGFVPGCDHNSYRGEVMAIIMGLNIAYKSTMFSDCSAAISVFEQLQKARDEDKCCPRVDHHDLWRHVWEHLCQRPKRCISLVKVKAHQDDSVISDPLEKWKAAGNNFVDVEAKSVVTQHRIHRVVLAAIQQREQLAALTIAYHDYICKLADASFLLLQQQRKFSRKEAEQQMNRPTFDFLIPNRVKPATSILAWDDLPRYCPYGKTFYLRFSDWYSTVQWPVVVSNDIMGRISLLELYFNFVVCTGTETPISTASRGKPSCYRLLDQDILLQTKTWSLSQHTRVWCMFWNWCTKCNVFQDPPVRTGNHFLEHVGYSLQTACLVGRPRLQHSEATYQALWEFFHRPEGRRKTTNAPLRPLPKVGVND